MKKYLEKQSTFSFGLKILAFFAQRRIFNWLTQTLTSQAAQLNVKLNKPNRSEDIQILADTWQKLMPPESTDRFRVESVKGNTAYTEIHSYCPLRGTGNVQACYKLMNYDRKLMEKVGGELIVLESQSNSGKNYCRLAIRKQGEDISDLTPAHLKTSN